MEITDIKLRKYFTEGPLEAIYSITFDNELALHDVKLVKREDGYMVVMPNRKLANGLFKDIVHPINSVFRDRISSQIVNFHKNSVSNNEIPSN
ncbi:MAG: SpoVG family protein [Eubacteriales bacterium]|nr:SpoVG family protein [Eubacteriales bacterium]